MLRKHSHILHPALAIGLFTLTGGAGDKITPADCKQAYDDGYLYYCEAVKCACDLIPGATFWHDGGEFGCGGSEIYGCFTPRGELFCYYGNEGDSCYYTPDELLNPDRDPDSPAGPTIGDAGQVLTPVESGPSTPGAIGGGPGSTELVETDTGDFDPGEAFQAGEVNAWFAPGAYGHGDDFQMDAFLADAPLDYLETLLDLQTSGDVRPDAPVAYYYDLKMSQDCNDNKVPDAVDIEESTSLDLNQNTIPDECEPDDFEGVNNPSPSNHADELTNQRDPNETDSSNDANAVTAQGSSSPCGSGAGLPVVMLSLCWMFVATGRISRRG